MLTLYLCRHAKSSWADPGQADFDRPLNERGLRNAPFMARQFRMRDEPLDLMITSTARRALDTARFFAQELGAKEQPDELASLGALDPGTGLQLIHGPGLYHATVNLILRTLNNLPSTYKRVMLFGHNPGFTDAVEFLATADIGNLPTCGAVRIDFPLSDWREVSRDLGTLIWMDHPKRHAGQD